MRFLGTASSGTAPVLAERKDAAWTQTTAPTELLVLLYLLYTDSGKHALWTSSLLAQTVDHCQWEKQGSDHQWLLKILQHFAKGRAAVELQS